MCDSCKQTEQVNAYLERRKKHNEREIWERISRVKGLIDFYLNKDITFDYKTNTLETLQEEVNILFDLTKPY
jgi:phosphosulfolactate phosphohydrolase-like enzyme